MLPSLEPTATPFVKSHLPPDARVLIVGASAVGKSALSRAIQRLARHHHLSDKGGPALSIAEAHGPRLPDLSALGEALELVLIVWEAGQGTPLPAYVARYTEQISEQFAGGTASATASGAEAATDTDASGADGGWGGSAMGFFARLRGAAAPAGAGIGEPAAPSTPTPKHAGGDRSGRSAWGKTTVLKAEADRDPSSDAANGDAQTTGPDAPSSSTSSPAPAARAPARPPRVLVVCNKCDVMPCPMPQIRGLPPSQAFIAVSAEKGTNLAHLWSMLQPVLGGSSLRRPPQRGGQSPPPPETTCRNRKAPIHADAEKVGGS